MKNHSFELINRVYELIQDEDYESAYRLIKPEAAKGKACICAKCAGAVA